MINITFFYKGKDHTGQLNLVGFEMSGHAGYDDYGKDIVCAAVSVLSINTVNALTELTDNKLSTTTAENGYLKVLSKQELDEKGALLMNALLMGVQSTYEEYMNEVNENEFINIKFEEV